MTDDLEHNIPTPSIEPEPVPESAGFSTASHYDMVHVINKLNEVIKLVNKLSKDNFYLHYGFGDSHGLGSYDGMLVIIDGHTLVKTPYSYDKGSLRYILDFEHEVKLVTITGSAYKTIDGYSYYPFKFRKCSPYIGTICPIRWANVDEMTLF